MPRSASLVIPFFLLIVLGILFLSHFFIYLSLVHFFDITGSARKGTLALILTLLPLSFIASSILARRVISPLSTALYFASGLWLGVGLTLMTFFAVAWAAWGATKLFAHSPGPAAFGGTAVVLAALYSGYGVWNAYHPRTKDLVVKIKNLPPEWRGRKVVQLSDVHLGRVLGAEFLARLVEKINAENPSMVFITGDLFDGFDAGLEKLVAPLNNLHGPWGTYFVTGNHETYLGTERAYEALRNTPARILRDEMVVIHGVQIIGISYPERGHPKDLAAVLKGLPGFDPRLPSILLYHSPTHIEQMKAVGINLQLSGHAHQGQLFPIQFISRLVYGKYFHGLHAEGDYTLYTSSGAGTWGPTMRTGNQPEIAVIRLE